MCTIYHGLIRDDLMWYAIKWIALFPEVTGPEERKGSDLDTRNGTRLIVLRPVAGFLVVPLSFFTSSSFHCQKWDFQHLLASSLYQSRLLKSSHWWILFSAVQGKCPVCFESAECVLCACVCVCVRMREHAHPLSCVWLHVV